MNITDWPNPDGWLDIIDHSLVALVMLLVAVIPTYITIKGNKGIKTIKDQVVNGHTASNLRDDLDKAIGAISVLSDELASFRSAVTREVAGLRRDISDEEERRRSHITDIRSEYDRKLKRLEDRE